MDKYTEFTKWAMSKGVKKYGIAAHKFEGRGLGIMAERKIEAGSVILKVPSVAIRTAHTVPKSMISKLGPITVHGLLATDLSLDTSPLRAPWRAVLPTSQDFLDTLPFAGASPPSPLSPSAQALLANQKRKFALDWASASKAYPSLIEEIYLYNWCLVNTRTFYYVKPGTLTPKNRDDCMALVPFADFFNHSAEGGCYVEYDLKGFTMRADRTYEKGEELYISYGNHSNDFLMVEYGFTIPGHRWDAK